MHRRIASQTMTRPYRRQVMHAGDGAFTLVEVLVACTVAAVILMAVYGVMSQTLLVWDRAATSADVTRSLRSAYTHLCSDLSLAVVYGGDPVGTFVLEDHENRDVLSFLASDIWPRAGEGDAPVVARLSYEVSSGRLVREGEVLSGSQPIGLALGACCVAQDLAVFDVQALGDDGWQASWSSSEKMPSALRITLQCADESQVTTVLLTGGGA